MRARHRQRLLGGSTSRESTRRFVRLFPATLLAFLVVIGSPSAHPGPTVKGFGTANVDGVMSAGEWQNAGSAAVTLNTGNGTTLGTLFAMTDDQYAYFALLVSRSVVSDAAETFGLFFSPLHDDVGPGRDYLLAYADRGARSVWASDLFSAGGTAQDDTSDGGSHDVVVAAKNTGSSTFFELRHPLDSADDRHDFSLQAGSLVSFSMLYLTYPAGGPRDGFRTDVGGFDFVVAPRAVRLTLRAAEVEGRYVESELLDGGLRVEGEVNDSQVPVLITVRRRGGEPFLQWEEDEVHRAFSLFLDLPTNFLPGRYIVAVQPKVAGAQGQERELVVPAPREGVVADVTFSATRAGPAVDGFPEGTKEIWARFRFAAQPNSVCTKRKVKTRVRVGGRIRTRTKTVHVCRPPILVTWFGPGELRSGQSVSKPNVPTVVSAVLSSGPLPVGTWRAVMTVGGKVVKRREIRVG